MLKGAKREHKTVMEIAKFYTDAFFEVCKKLNIKRPDVVEPATNCIDEFIHMIITPNYKFVIYKIARKNVEIPVFSSHKMFITLTRTIKSQSQNSKFHTLCNSNGWKVNDGTVMDQ